MSSDSDVAMYATLLNGSAAAAASPAAAANPVAAASASSSSGAAPAAGSAVAAATPSASSSSSSSSSSATGSGPPPSSKAKSVPSASGASAAKPTAAPAASAGRKLIVPAGVTKATGDSDDEEATLNTDKPIAQAKKPLKKLTTLASKLSALNGEPTPAPAEPAEPDAQVPAALAASGRAVHVFQSALGPRGDPDHKDSQSVALSQPLPPKAAAAPPVTTNGTKSATASPVVKPVAEPTKAKKPPPPIPAGKLEHGAAEQKQDKKKEKEKKEKEKPAPTAVEDEETNDDEEDDEGEDEDEDDEDDEDADKPLTREEMRAIVKKNRLRLKHMVHVDDSDDSDDSFVASEGEIEAEEEEARRIAKEEERRDRAALKKEREEKKQAAERRIRMQRQKERAAGVQASDEEPVSKKHKVAEDGDDDDDEKTPDAHADAADADQPMHEDAGDEEDDDGAGEVLDVDALACGDDPDDADFEVAGEKKNIINTKRAKPKERARAAVGGALSRPAGLDGVPADVEEEERIVYATPTPSSASAADTTTQSAPEIPDAELAVLVKRWLAMVPNYATAVASVAAQGRPDWPTKLVRLTPHYMSTMQKIVRVNCRIYRAVMAYNNGKDRTIPRLRENIDLKLHSKLNNGDCTLVAYASYGTHHHHPEIYHLFVLRERRTPADAKASSSKNTKFDYDAVELTYDTSVKFFIIAGPKVPKPAVGVDGSKEEHWALDDRQPEQWPVQLLAALAIGNLGKQKITNEDYGEFFLPAPRVPPLLFHHALVLIDKKKYPPARIFELGEKALRVMLPATPSSDVATAAAAAAAKPAAAAAAKPKSPAPVAPPKQAASSSSSATPRVPPAAAAAAASRTPASTPQVSPRVPGNTQDKKMKNDNKHDAPPDKTAKHRDACRGLLVAFGDQARQKLMAGDLALVTEALMHQEESLGGTLIDASELASTSEQLANLVALKVSEQLELLMHDDRARRHLLSLLWTRAVVQDLVGKSLALPSALEVSPVDYVIEAFMSPCGHETDADGGAGHALTLLIGTSTCKCARCSVVSILLKRQKKTTDEMDFAGRLSCLAIVSLTSLRPAAARLLTVVDGVLADTFKAVSDVRAKYTSARDNGELQSLVPLDPALLGFSVLPFVASSTAPLATIRESAAAVASNYVRPESDDVDLPDAAPAADAAPVAFDPSLF